MRSKEMTDKYCEALPKLLKCFDKEGIQSVLLIYDRDEDWQPLYSLLKKMGAEQITIDSVFREAIEEELTLPRSYDAILLIEQLQLLSYKKGLQFIEQLMQYVTKVLIVTTPVYTNNTIWGIPYFAQFNVETISFEEFLMFTFYPLHPVVTLSNRKESKGILTNRAKKLKIAYLLPHKRLTGGLKMLLQQMERLKARGHEVYAVMRTNEVDQIGRASCRERVYVLV